MASLAVVPPPTTPATTKPLYEIEERLAALTETAELVPPEQEQEFAAELHHALTTAIDKRDRVGHFLAHCESQVELADTEIKRLKDRKAMYQRASETMERYVVRVIESLGMDGKRYRKLEGKTVTFSIRACPASVEVTNKEAIPVQYGRVTVTLPATLWARLLDNFDIEERQAIMSQLGKYECDVMKEPIKEDLVRKMEVPGARLITDKHWLKRD